MLARCRIDGQYVWSVFSASGEFMANTGSSKSDLPASPNPFKTLALSAIVPLIVMVGLLLCSPNYQAANQDFEQPISYPLGGDFLQEYVGGRLILNPAKRDHLYDAATFQDTQHDAQVVGFTWDQEQFFPAVYPPFWYSAVSPLSNLPYLVASRVWLVLMTLTLVTAVWILNRYANVPAPVVIVMCLSAPVIQNLSAGQKGTLLLLILSVSYVLLRKRKDFWSGLVFALIAFKPHLAIVIGLWMLVSRNWRWCVGAFSGLAVLVISSLVISPNLVSNYVNVVAGFGDYVQSGGYELNESFSCWSFWQQLIRNTVGAKVFTGITSLLVFGASLWVFRLRLGSTVTSTQIDRSFSAMVIVTMLTSPHLYAYDLTMLLLPIGLMTRIALTSGADQSDQQRNYADWLPVGLMALVMFASGAIASFAASSGFQAGFLLLVTVWIAIMRPVFVETLRVS